MHLRSEVSAEPLGIALRSGWLSVHMTAVSFDGKSHSSVRHVTASSSSFNEVPLFPEKDR